MLPISFSFSIFFKIKQIFEKIFFIKKPIGVITKKNIIPIIIGETIFPNSKPNLNHNLFKGLKIKEFF